MLQGLSCGKRNINLGMINNPSLLNNRQPCLSGSNHVPWAILTASSIVSGILLLLLRFLLVLENSRRETDNTYDDVHLKVETNGTTTENKVNNVIEEHHLLKT
jgi:hypothetical protein